MQTSATHIPAFTKLEWAIEKAASRIRLYSEVVDAKLSRPDVNIVGSYPGPNIGDLAMGWTLRESLKREGMTSVLHNHMKSDIYPTPSRVLIGGGGLIPHTAPRLERLFDRNPDMIENSVAVGLGVGRDLSPGELSEEFISYLSRMAFVSVRSSYDREQLRLATGLSDIPVYPDIAFAMPSLFGFIPKQKESSDQILGMSIIPFFTRLIKGRFVCTEESAQWGKDEHFAKGIRGKANVGPGYLEFIRSVIAAHVSSGWKVRIISFHIEDYAFARAALSDLDVEIPTFRADPMAVLRQVDGCSKFLASRFHAHVFALMSRTPLVSFAYDLKCDSLWTDLGLPPEAQIDRSLLTEEVTPLVDKVVDHSGVQLQDELISAVSNAAKNGIDSGLKRLTGA